MPIGSKLSSIRISLKVGSKITNPRLHMLVRFPVRVRPPARTSNPLLTSLPSNPTSPFLIPKPWNPPYPSRMTLSMTQPEAKTRRPTCPTCSKPTRLCLCTRIRTHGLDNKVSVTILQHALEIKHPLNSARIARLGLKNVSLYAVSDANFGARFVIRLLEPGRVGDGGGSLDFDGAGELGDTQEGKVEDSGLEGQNGNFGSTPWSEECSSSGGSEAGITAVIGKYGGITDIESVWMPRTRRRKRPSFDEILASEEAVEALAKGFVVKKLQKRQLSGKVEPEEYEEYELAVPTGTVLLFPTDNAVGVDELNAMNFEVKNLIVLDGTWAKARRMYEENPWLRLLPHLKLEFDRLSLYSEVRHQPKAGYLSTIESVVYALKAVGDHPEGLDNLLDVFESMVGDQRQCKDERLNQASAV